MRRDDVERAVIEALPSVGQREFLSPEELADELGVSANSLAILRSRGGGPPFVRVGRRVRYPVVALRLWSLSVARTRAVGS